MRTALGTIMRLSPSVSSTKRRSTPVTSPSNHSASSSFPPALTRRRDPTPNGRSTWCTSRPALTFHRTSLAASAATASAGSRTGATPTPSAEAAPAVPTRAHATFEPRTSLSAPSAPMPPSSSMLRTVAHAMWSANHAPHATSPSDAAPHRMLPKLESTTLHMNPLAITTGSRVGRVAVLTKSHTCAATTAATAGAWRTHALLTSRSRMATNEGSAHASSQRSISRSGSATSSRTSSPSAASLCASHAYAPPTSFTPWRTRRLVVAGRSSPSAPASRASSSSYA
mmetsp:Transcript_23281/g.79226  ORF Transcript_23281/g.79226 Transcript_23281/m.79226 type:complete len:284 (+) Transcript_23281:134-985(+)